MQAELVERASQGDRDAFASLAASLVDRCYALAYRILRNPDRAQDATQQALLGAWRDLATLRDLARFDAAPPPGGQRLLCGGTRPTPLDRPHCSSRSATNVAGRGALRRHAR
jgi:hypothetical protein